MNSNPNRKQTVLGTNDGSFAPKTNTAPGAAATLTINNVDEVDDADFDRTLHDTLGSNRLVVMGNDRGQLDPSRRFDYLEIADSDQAGRIRVTGLTNIDDDLLQAAASLYEGTSEDEYEAEAAGIEFLNEHQSAIENVLAEDYGAVLDPSHDEWDNQEIHIQRTLPSDNALSEAVEAVTVDDRAAALHDMIYDRDYHQLLDEAIKHKADRETTKDLGGRLLDHLTNTVGNDAAERARYATIATVWTPDPENPHSSEPAYEVTAFDSAARPLGEPIRLLRRDGLAFKRNRFPSDMTVPESDPNEPVLLNSAQNSNSVLDLDKVGGNIWGRAKP